MTSHYIGIDPGQKGGIAILGPDDYVLLFEMPDTEARIWNVISVCNGMDAFGYVELVHSMPGQGVSSTFKFGVGYGGLKMALMAAGIPREDVTPRTWQKAFGISPRDKKGNESKDAFKKRLLAKAEQLFPTVTHINLKTCDALLIAEYGRRKWEGRL